MTDKSLQIILDAIRKASDIRELERLAAKYGYSVVKEPVHAS